MTNVESITQLIDILTRAKAAEIQIEKAHKLSELLPEHQWNGPWMSNATWKKLARTHGISQSEFIELRRIAIEKGFADRNRTRDKVQCFQRSFRLPKDDLKIDFNDPRNAHRTTFAEHEEIKAKAATFADPTDRPQF